MSGEILNIDYHVCRMLLKALNTLPSKMQAYWALGISEKTMYNYIRRFGVVRDTRGIYIATNQPIIKP